MKYETNPNEPNFKKAEMNVGSVITMDYEDISNWAKRTQSKPILAKKYKNKHKTNPKQTQFQRQKMLMLLSAGGCENFAFWLYLPALICVNLWPMEETSIKRASKALMILPMAGPPFVRAADCFVRINNMFESCLFRQKVPIEGD
jgi:hypothetical protein